MTYRLNLLGGASIESDAGPLTGTVTQRRRMALLALLAGSPTGAMSRDRLAAYLFPEVDAAHAHKGLADALHGIRAVLGRDALLGVGGEVRLDSDVVRADLAEFRHACGSGDAERAAALYRGPFLDGFFVPGVPEFERWVDAVREEVAAELGRALAAAAEAREAEGDLSAAVGWWRRLAAHQPDSTRVALRLVAALERSGDVAAALRQATLHETMLRETLGVPPSDELTRVIERLRAAPPRREPAAAMQPPTAAPAALPPAAAPTPSERGAAGWWSPRPLLVGGALVTLAMLGLGLPAVRRSEEPRAAPPPIRSIAVLPLENLGGDRGREFFADGMTDALITELARLGDVRVTSRTSVMRYRGTRGSVRAIARELGVDAVVEGTVVQEGSRVRIGARLSRASDEGTMWAESYVRDVRELLPLQAEIAHAVAGAIRARVADGAGRAAAPAGSVDPQAYAFYLKAMHLWNEDDRANQREAIRYLDASLSREPDFAPAHAAMAEIYVHLDEWANRSPESEGASEKALTSVRRALALDERLAEAHTSLAHLLMHQEDWTGSEAEFRRALALNPNLAYARILYAFHLVARRQFDAAVHEAEQAVALDPLSARTQMFAAYTLYAARRYDAAVDRWTRMLDLHPSSSVALMGLARAHLHAGRTGEGLAWAARAARGRGTADSALVVASAAAVAGRASEARAALRVAVDRGDAPIDPLDVAMVHAALGDRVQAFAWLERAMAEDHGWTMFLDVDPGYDAIRDDPRFEALLRRMRLRD